MKIDSRMRERVVTMLSEDARKSLRSIARELGISTTTAGKIVAGLEKDGILRGYTVHVDWHSLGYRSVLCIQISAAAGADIEKLGKRLRGIPEVKQAFYTTGEASFSVYIVCRDNDEASAVIAGLKSIPGVERVVPHTVLKMF